MLTATIKLPSNPHVNQLEITHTCIKYIRSDAAIFQYIRSLIHWWQKVEAEGTIAPQFSKIQEQIK